MKQLLKIIIQNQWRKILSLFNIFGKNKLLLAFEYGIILSEVAKDQGIILSQDHVEKAEGIILDIFKKGNPERIAVDMMANILSMFETDMTK